MVALDLTGFSNLGYFGKGNDVKGWEHFARSPNLDFGSLASAFIMSGAIVLSVLK